MLRLTRERATSAEDMVVVVVVVDDVRARTRRGLRSGARFVSAPKPRITARVFHLCRHHRHRHHGARQPPGKTMSNDDMIPCSPFERINARRTIYEEDKGGELLQHKHHTTSTVFLSNDAI